MSGRNASPAAKADVWLTARAGSRSNIGKDLSFALFAYRPCCVLTVMSSKWGCFGLRWHVLGRLDVKSESRLPRLLRLHGGLDRHVSRLQPPRGPCQRLGCSVRGVRAWRFGAACEQAVRSGSICAGHRGRKMARYHRASKRHQETGVISCLISVPAIRFCFTRVSCRKKKKREE